MKLKRKATALILSLMMVLSMVPAMAFAGDEAAVKDENTAEDPSVEVMLDEEQDVYEEEPAVEEEDPVIVEIEEPAVEEEEETDEQAVGEEETTEEPVAEEAFDEDEEDFNDSEEIVTDESEDLAEGEDIPDDADYGEMALDFDLSIDLDEEELFIDDPEEQVEEFLLSDDEEAEVGETAPANKSVKGDRLCKVDKKYYNIFKSIIKKVSKANTSKKTISTKRKYSVKHFIGSKRTYTAKQLGVKKIGYKKNGRWYISSKAMKKINALVGPKDWKKVYTSLLTDLSNESYWVDWHHGKTFVYENKCTFRYTRNSITFDKGASITLRLAVQPEFQGSTYKANTKKIKKVKNAKAYAKSLVKTFDDAIPTVFEGYSNAEIDVYRLWNYCRWIANDNTYNHEAADAYYDTYPYKGAWSWVYVFDQNSSTNAVCEGYARAFKYLCDISKFKSRWIDCHIVAGKTEGSSEGHMWNIVRMNDGKNYVIDPTWMDQENGYDVDSVWFLRGDPNGTADKYTIEGIYRKYDSWTKKAFAPAERKLSKKDYYEYVKSKKIKLKKTKIKTATGGRKSIKLKWNKVSTPLGALYIDGYQIQYGTKKSMKGAKKIKVKGYNHTSKTIKKKLKRGKKYYVRIRTYAKVGNKTYYSKWTKKKKVRVR